MMIAYNYQIVELISVLIRFGSFDECCDELSITQGKDKILFCMEYR